MKTETTELEAKLEMIEKHIALLSQGWPDVGKPNGPDILVIRTYLKIADRCRSDINAE